MLWGPCALGSKAYAYISNFCCLCNISNSHLLLFFSIHDPSRSVTSKKAFMMWGNYSFSLSLRVSVIPCWTLFSVPPVPEAAMQVYCLELPETHSVRRQKSLGCGEDSWWSFNMPYLPWGSREISYQISYHISLEAHFLQTHTKVGLVMTIRSPHNFTTRCSSAPSLCSHFLLMPEYILCNTFINQGILLLSTHHNIHNSPHSISSHFLLMPEYILCNTFINQGILLLSTHHNIHNSRVVFHIPLVNISPHTNSRCFICFTNIIFCG